ncbi:reverse transcriptase domain-containing protein, partial [Tanacetum coccineum]
MDDNRTMAQMLQAPIEGYEDAIVVPTINANNFELKQTLINLVQSNQFTGKQDPHNHLRFFNKVTSTFRHPKVSNTSIKLLLFPFSLEGEARTWLDKEPPRSILTWDDLISKFINQFFPPSKTTYLRNKITTFYQEPNETFNEAWERFKGLLRQCPHHAIINEIQGFRYSRSRANDSRVSTDAPLSNSSPSNNSFDMQQIAASLEDKMTIKMKQMMNEMKALVVTTPAPIKAVEEVCVTCGSNHNFNHCPLTRGGNDFPVFHDNIQQFQQTAAVGNFLQRNQPSNLASQMRPPGFNQPNVQNNQTNQNRYQGNNFNSNQNRGTNFNQNRPNNQGAVYQAPPYQPPTNQPLVNQALPPVSQIQGVSKTDFESYAKANDANMNNLQMKLDNFQRNQNNFQRSYNDSQKKQDDFQNLMLGFMQNYHNNSTASTSRSGTLPSQTITNPREHVNAITTRSGKTLEGPSTPLVPTPVISIPQKEPVQNPETSTEKVQNPNVKNTAHVPSPEEEESIFMEIPKPKAKKTVNVEIQDLNSPRPTSYQSRIPYPERMKVRENDKPRCYKPVTNPHEQITVIHHMKSVKTVKELSPLVLHHLIRIQSKLPFREDESEREEENDKPSAQHSRVLEISTSQSQENVHQSLVIESLPVSPIPVKDSDPAQEEINIFLVPDDLIPPGVENDDFEDEYNELPNLVHQDDLSIPRPPPKPLDVEKCFEPEAGILIIKVFKGVSKPHDFMVNILPTLPTLVSDLSFILFLSLFLSFGSEDTIFDLGIITFPFSYLEPVAFSMKVFCSKNKKDERGVVVRNKVTLVAQGHKQEEGMDYDEVFAPVARIEAIRIFLAFASYMRFIVYQMDVKSAFLYDTIDEEVYVSQPPGFIDPKFPKKVYKVVKALYGLHQAPRA